MNPKETLTKKEPDLLVFLCKGFPFKTTFIKPWAERNERFFQQSHLLGKKFKVHSPFDHLDHPNIPNHLYHNDHLNNLYFHDHLDHLDHHDHIDGMILCGHEPR